MAERDLARELVRRAYGFDTGDDMSSDAELSEGLDEVVRRAGRGPAVDLGVLPAPDRHRASVRRRRNGIVAIAAAGVAAALVIGVGVVAARFAGHGGGEQVGIPPVSAPPSPDWSPGPDSSSRGPSAGPREIPDILPADIPSSCASAWTLAFAGGTFTVGSRGSVCDQLDASRLWLMDAGDCSGLIGPGAAKIYPIKGVSGRVSAPFSFTVAGLDHLQGGHCYELTYLHTSIMSSASPGADAELFESHGSRTISLTIQG